jgi:hypothetical protein
MPNSPPLFLPKPPQNTSDIGAIKRWLYLVYLSIYNSAGIVVPIPITEGGTGADNLSDAQTNLGIIPLPIAGDTDLVLQTNGSNDPVWSTYKLIMGGDINVENALTTTGDFPLTLTALGITDSTLPAGTHSLAPLDSPTFTGSVNLNSSETAGQLLSVINTATTGTPTAGVLIYSQVTGGGYPYITFLMTAPTKIFTVGIDPSDFGFKVCRDASTSSVVDFSISTAGIATFTNTVNANISGNAATVTTIPALTGDITTNGSTNVTTYNNVVPLSKSLNANLTASNGGIFYSTATAGAILSGTATAGQIIRSGANAAPSWSTTTYPATDAINTIRYFSSANVAGNITAAASSVLITSAGDVPSLSQTLPTAVQNNITAVNSAANTLSIGGSVKTFTSGTANVPSYSAVTAFSPGLSFGGATTGIVYTQQSGFYRTTTYPNGTIETAVWGIVRISSKGSATGTARLTTLPTAGGANNSNTYAPFFPAGITVAAGAIPFLQLVNFASTAIITSTNFNGGAFAAVTDAQFANTASVAFNFTYWNN